MCDALSARLRASETPRQIGIHYLANRSVGSGYTLDSEFLEEHDRPPSHTAGNHHVCLETLDESRHLAGLVLGETGIRFFPHGGNRSLGDVHHSEVRASPEMRAYNTIESVCIIHRDRDTHDLFLPF
jgi:hypothetical protein